MHFFGSERGPPRDADPVRHLPGHEHLHALGLEPRAADLDPVLHARHRARRGALSRPRTGPSTPASRRPRRQHRRRPQPLLARTQPRRRRSEPRRARRRRPRRASPRPSPGVPYCSDAALAAAADSSYSGPRRAGRARAARPRSQIGTAIAGAGAGTHPLYVPGKVYLAGPYKGAPLSLGVDHPGGLGPL